MLPHALLAIGFGNLAMLGWLAAAAAPLLIHLWSRHRFREEHWAAVQFLIAAMRKNARRLQLQQWLLLAVRTLLIVLVVLAVAEPYGEGLVAGTSTTVPAHKVIVIDASYSMAYDSERNSITNTDVTAETNTSSSDTTNLDRAKRLAAELMRDSSPSDEFTVILLADPARLILGREVVDSSVVADHIESLRQTDTGADLSSALALVAEALDQNANDPRGHERQEVYFFTDLQRTTWAPGSSRLNGEGANEDNGSGLISKLASLVPKTQLVVVDVGALGAANLAVTQVSVDVPFVIIGRDTPITATLRLFGDEPRSDCEVELLVDNVPVAEQTIDVPADGEATVRFLHRFDTVGTHTVALRAADDALTIDNTRWLVLPVRERVRVLCVAGVEGAADYVARALDPGPAAASPIEPVVVSEGDMADLALDDFDCIFFCNIAQLTASEALRLTRYAERGGGIAFFLGDRAIAEQFNSLAPPKPAVLAGTQKPSIENERRPAQDSPQDAAATLIPVRLGPVKSIADFGIDPVGYRHPVVAPFRGQERTGLLTTPISQFFALDLSHSRPSVEVAAALRDGSPLIVTAPLGLGRIAVVATDGSLTSVNRATGEPWTTWPTWPSFLPIVRELLAYVTGGRQNEWQLPVGAQLVGVLTAQSASAVDDDLKIARPDGRVDAVSIVNSPDGLRWAYGETDLSGMYSLRGAAADSIIQFAVNVDTAEGELAKADASQLPEALLVRETWRDAASVNAAGMLRRSTWDRTLLWIALAMLFVESLMAWRFGRGTV
jgi:hypothetical protein